jgi:hypothetical protein
MGEEIFPVKKRCLRNNLGLFQDEPFLLSAGEYEVQSQVPREVLATFAEIVEGGPITLSEDTYQPLGRLAVEFRFQELVNACSMFLASRGRADSRHRVTISFQGRSRTFEVLKSIHEVRDFAHLLQKANPNDIVIDGVRGRGRIVEEAMGAIYSNALAFLPESDTKPSFLVVILWAIRRWGYGWDINTILYCMNRIHEIAPTAFDKAKHLLLSQCDPNSPDDFIPMPDADWVIIEDALFMLKTEKNRKVRDAKELLRQLRGCGRYGSIFEKLDARDVYMGYEFYRPK